MKLMVTGGAGYIGSVCTARLVESGHEVHVVDDLSTGHRDAVHPDARFIAGDLAEVASRELDSSYDGVLHFAARSLVAESMHDPAAYWHGNVVTSLRLLDAMRAAGVARLVFSSTAATYGEPQRTPIAEEDPTRPTNPYGATKLAIDMAITSYAQAYDIGAVSLRYFNVGGAYRSFGERHVTETHLIPIVLQVAAGAREQVSLYGDDWPTADGTCIRDYLHVLDLAEAHLAALQQARRGVHRIFNLGSGSGFSVKQVLHACREITGHPIPAEVAARRPGDPAALVASSEAARAELGWRPQHAGLEQIVADAWEFARAQQPPAR